MAPKKSAAAASNPAPAPAPTTSTTTTTTTTTNTAPSVAVAKPSASDPQSINQVSWNIVEHYQKTTPQRTKLLDVFMAFLVVVGGLQFAYCILAGNYPFNAFLSGFSATVGQFVLTASLRIQTTEANKAEFPSVSPERAFADYVVGSLILHFFCVNFIN
ncbi:defender against death DAD protein [Daldinia caldariorum]|uniref:defender against death DAD protein n=1 Tax=Daldinia caldariorum TaxID=326644 RepID=UPI002007A53F|nr:defender against death DAD protein [Daldinia caldariorum]KAI1465796.1 defender against death DAD protein [Daldinia caldariorum]